MKFINLKTSPNNQLQQIGWDWALGQDTLPYIANEIIEVLPTQAEAFKNAVVGVKVANKVKVPCKARAMQHVPSVAAYGEDFAGLDVVVLVKREAA